MNNSRISFLYPDRKSGIYKLQLTDSFFKFNGDKILGKKIVDYFTDDIEVINYRNEFFDALLKSKDLRNSIILIKEKLKDFYENFYYAKKISPTTESALRSLLISKDYIFLIKDLYNILSPYSDMKITSLREIYLSVFEEMQNQDFLMFEKEILKYGEKLNQIKSITIGVNLDAQLKPKEAGLISINTESFKSGNIIDRFFRLEFKRDEYCCIAPLTSMTERSYSDKLRVDEAINNALDSIIKGSAIKTLKETIKIIENRMAKFSLLVDELEITVSVINYIKTCEEKKLPLCITEFNIDRTEIKDFYDLLLLKKNINPIKNDIVIPKNAKNVIFTGQNSGGKTASIRALGLIYLFSLLGIPVPCRKAVLNYIPTDIIVSFSPENSKESKGRLEQECEELGKILKKSNLNNIVFLDEPFVTTSPREASILLEDFVNRFVLKDNTIVFITTHFLDFVSKSSKNDNVFCYELNGFKIIPNSIAKQSNAKSISEKYW